MYVIPPKMVFCILGIFINALILNGSLSAHTALHKVPKALKDGHSHNDYYRRRPLLDALENGFCSVEADVFLHKGKLMVGHIKAEVFFARSLEELYLAPLKKWVEEHDGCVFPDAPHFYLWIELKSDAQETWNALLPLLKKYESILTVTEDGKTTKRAVQVILTGNRPMREFYRLEKENHLEKQNVKREEGSGDNPLYATLDGRLEELDGARPSWVIRAINDKWSNHFTWRGKGEFPPQERQKLEKIVEKAHAQGRIVRFWGTPQNENFWRVMRECKVDLLGTDHLEKFRNFTNAELRDGESEPAEP